MELQQIEAAKRVMAAMAATVFLVLILLSSPVRAQDWAEVNALASQVESGDLSLDEWPYEAMDSAMQKAVRTAVTGADARGAVAELAAAVQLPESTSRALLWTALHVLESLFPDNCEEAALPGDTEASLIEALVAKDPAASAVLSTAALALSDSWRCPAGERVRDALAAHRAVETAYALASNEESNYFAHELLFGLISEIEGPSARLLMAKAPDLYGLERPAALEWAGELAAQEQVSPADLAAFRLQALLDVGLWRRALALLEEHGDALLESVERIDSEEGEGAPSRRLDVAAAYLLTGEPAEARARIAQLRPEQRRLPTVAADGENLSFEQRQARDILEFEARVSLAVGWVTEGGGPVDPFELLAELALENESASVELSSRGTLRLFLSDLSQHFDFDSLADYFLWVSTRQIEIASGSLDRAASGEADGEVLNLGAWLRILRDELTESIGTGAAVGEPVPEPEASDTDRVPSGYRVRPLHPDDLAEEPAASSLATAPEGFSLLRSEHAKGIDVLLATSQALDPVGEVSPGSYWVLRSVDGGVNWAAYPTGLRVAAPYVAEESSRRSLMTPDGLAIEVRWANLDEGSITFPPIAVKVDRREEPLVVEIPWSVLTSDRDGDGLTDLFEARVFTNPDDADTDGDGLPDFDDLLPGVAYAATGEATSEAMSALLRAIGDEEQKAILPSCPGGRPGLCFSATSPGLERVLYVVGEPSVWAGVSPSRRTIVLTPERHRLATARWGPFYATRFKLFQIDAEGKRGVAVWDRSWQGGAARLELTEMGWKVIVRSTWVS